jgi:hypothetical protein
MPHAQVSVGVDASFFPRSRSPRSCNFGIISPDLTLAVIVAVGLLVIDVTAWRLVSALFNRERLITGATPRHARPARWHPRRSS